MPNFQVERTGTQWKFFSSERRDVAAAIQPIVSLQIHPQITKNARNTGKSGQIHAPKNFMSLCVSNLSDLHQFKYLSINGPPSRTHQNQVQKMPYLLCLTPLLPKTVRQPVASSLVSLPPIIGLCQFLLTFGIGGEGTGKRCCRSNPKIIKKGPESG
jgi:hypothetical protein